MCIYVLYICFVQLCKVSIDSNGILAYSEQDKYEIGPGKIDVSQAINITQMDTINTDKRGFLGENSEKGIIVKAPQRSSGIICTDTLNNPILIYY